MKKLVLNNALFLMIVCSASAALAMGGIKGRPYCETKYPIMLVHGALGWGTLSGVVDYWYQIPKGLEACGATVRVAVVPALNSSEERGEALLEQVEDFLAETGKSKVHLIGHSHGSLAVRYAAYVRPDLVASVTTIAGCHQGIPQEVIDRLMRPGPEWLDDMIARRFNTIGVLISVLQGVAYEQDAKAVIEELDNGAALFNAKYPSAGVPPTQWGEGAHSEIVDGHEILYYSWIGNNEGMTNCFDVLDYPLVLVARPLYEWCGAGDVKTDGLVPIYSAHFGNVLCDTYNWNHADEVNLLFGLRSPFSANPVQVFRTHANRLQQAGL